MSHLPDMLGSNTKIASNLAENPVEGGRHAQLGRDTFKVIGQLEPSNMNGAYAARISLSRGICMPAKKKERTPQAARIAQLREELRLNQEGFADAIGIDQGTVSKWEGDGAKPGVHTYVLLALLTKRADLRSFLLRDSGDGARRAYETVVKGLRENAPPAPKETVDVDTLAFVVGTLQSALRKRGLQLSDSKFAELIALCYDFCRETHTRNPDTIERFLRVA